MFNMLGKRADDLQGKDNITAKVRRTPYHRKQVTFPTNDDVISDLRLKYPYIFRRLDYRLSRRLRRPSCIGKQPQKCANSTTDYHYNNKHFDAFNQPIPFFAHDITKNRIKYFSPGCINTENSDYVFDDVEIRNKEQCSTNAPNDDNEILRANEVCLVSSGDDNIASLVDSGQIKFTSNTTNIKSEIPHCSSKLNSYEENWLRSTISENVNATQASGDKGIDRDKNENRDEDKATQTILSSTELSKEELLHKPGAMTSRLNGTTEMELLDNITTNAATSNICDSNASDELISFNNLSRHSSSQNAMPLGRLDTVVKSFSQHNNDKFPHNLDSSKIVYCQKDHKNIHYGNTHKNNNNKNKRVMPPSSKTITTTTTTSTTTTPTSSSTTTVMPTAKISSTASSSSVTDFDTNSCTYTANHHQFRSESSVGSIRDASAHVAQRSIRLESIRPTPVQTHVTHTIADVDIDIANDDRHVTGESPSINCNQSTRSFYSKPILSSSSSSSPRKSKSMNHIDLNPQNSSCSEDNVVGESYLAHVDGFNSKNSYNSDITRILSQSHPFRSCRETKGRDQKTETQMDAWLSQFSHTLQPDDNLQQFKHPSYGTLRITNSSNPHLYHQREFSLSNNIALDNPNYDPPTLPHFPQTNEAYQQLDAILCSSVHDTPTHTVDPSHPSTDGSPSVDLISQTRSSYFDFPVHPAGCKSRALPVDHHHHHHHGQKYNYDDHYNYPNFRHVLSIPHLHRLTAPTQQGKTRKVQSEMNINTPRSSFDVLQRPSYTGEKDLLRTGDHSIDLLKSRSRLSSSFEFTNFRSTYFNARSENNINNNSNATDKSRNISCSPRTAKINEFIPKFSLPSYSHQLLLKPLGINSSRQDTSSQNGNYDGNSRLMGSQCYDGGGDIKKSMDNLVKDFLEGRRF